MRLETNRDCRGCGKAVSFVPSAASRQIMVLDPDPTPEGNVVVHDGKAHVLKRDESGLFAREGEPRYTDHHATCPNAADFRRSKKK